MIYYLEADLSGAPIGASNTNNSDLSEVANADEAITSESKDSNEIYILILNKKERQKHIKKK